MTDNIEKLVKSIINIIDKNTNNKIIINNIIPKYTSNKYSSIDNKIWRLNINNNDITKNSPYNISYKCLTCSKENTISCIQFIRKLNKEHPEYCYFCRNSNEEKRNKQSQIMTQLYSGEYQVKQKINISIMDKYNKSIEVFNTLDNDIKEQYFKKHLTCEEYNYIKQHIISICDGTIMKNEFEKYEYLPIYHASNQMKYTSVLYDISNNIIIKPNKPILKCEICQKQWKSKNLEIHKGSLKIMCHDCKLCRKIFKIRNTTNIINNNILYQSQLELKFINWCNNNNIIVTNGPNISYFFNLKNRIYKIDFYLPQINLLIEVKDDHIWHIRQVNNGNWDAKINAVNEILKNNNDLYNEYILLKPNNWNDVLLSIKNRFK